MTTKKSISEQIPSSLAAGIMDNRIRTNGNPSSSVLTRLVHKLVWDVTDYFRADNMIVALALSAIVYCKRLPLEIASLIFYKAGRKFCYDLDGTTQRYMVLEDVERDALWIVIRGTGGNNFIDRVKSWAYNFMIWKRENGAAVGFSRLTDNIYNHMLANIPTLMTARSTVYITGTSQGAACAMILADKLRTLYKELSIDPDRAIVVFGFAAPPAGDANFARRLQREAPYITGYLVRMPGDPIYTEIFRNDNSRVLNGQDCFELVDIQDINRLDRGLSRLNNHSPTQYLASLATMVANTKTMSQVVKDISLRLIGLVIEETEN